MTVTHGASIGYWNSRPGQPFTQGRHRRQRGGARRTRRIHDPRLFRRPPLAAGPELPAIAEAGVEGRDAGYRFAACAPKWREIIRKAGIEKE